MLKRLALGVCLSAILGLLTSPIALAKTTNSKPSQAKQSLVALGDSITYGYNLNTNVKDMTNNHHSSRSAFPYLMGGSENMRVRDLGVSGWTSQQLLNDLQSNKKFQQAVRHANVVTIDIGSNDLLDVLKTSGLSTKDLARSGEKLDSVTLPAILEKVKSLNPSVRIVLYNIYDPFPADSSNPMFVAIHQVADQYLPVINEGIMWDAAKYGATYADAFTAFAGKQNQYVIPGGVHPTSAGQAALAQVGEKALARLTP